MSVSQALLQRELWRLKKLRLEREAQAQLYTNTDKEDELPHKKHFPLICKSLITSEIEIMYKPDQDIFELGYYLVKNADGRTYKIDSTNQVSAVEKWSALYSLWNKALELKGKLDEQQK